MTIEAECRVAATAAAHELCKKYDFTGESDVETQEMLTSIQTIITNHMISLLTRNAPVARPAKESSPKGPKVKKSSRPNHYAFFHSCCSAQGAQYAWTLVDYIFKYQPDPELVLKKEGQKGLYDALHADEEKLKRFEAFYSKGDIQSVVRFVESEFPEIPQMTRTAVIWNQFLTNDDREKHKTWYAEETKEGDVPARTVRKVTTPPLHLNIKARSPPPHVDAPTIEVADAPPSSSDHENEETLAVVPITIASTEEVPVVASTTEAPELVVPAPKGKLKINTRT